MSVWRGRFDPSAAHGMPAHITALYPFLAVDQLTEGVVAQLTALCEGLPVLDVQFQRTNRRFPSVLYLDPDPADGLRQLTTAIASTWPQAPPYCGRFDQVIPHLTVAQGIGDPLLTKIEWDLLSRLPFRTRLSEAGLYVFDGAQWQRQARLPFSRPPDRCLADHYPSSAPGGRVQQVAWGRVGRVATSRKPAG